MKRQNKLLTGAHIIILFIVLYMLIPPLFKTWPPSFYILYPALLIFWLTAFSQHIIFKIGDFLYQTVLIGHLFNFPHGLSGQSLGWALMFAVLLVFSYQFLSSLIIIARQLDENKLSGFGLFRLAGCLAVIGLLVLGAALRGSGSLFYLDFKKSNAFIDLDVLFGFFFIPFFILITSIERLTDIKNAIKNRRLHRPNGAG